MTWLYPKPVTLTGRVRTHRIHDDHMPTTVPKRVRLGGEEFESIREAAISKRMSRHTIEKWLKDGRAEYVE